MQACQQAHSDVVTYQSISDFILNSVILFMLVHSRFFISSAPNVSVGTGMADTKAAHCAGTLTGPDV